MNEPNFKILCNFIHELLNVSEDSAQRVHTLYTQLFIRAFICMHVMLMSFFITAILWAVCFFFLVISVVVFLWFLKK